MKKIIANKVYDTSTAIKIAAWDNGHYANDIDYLSEDLYRKKTGEFFLHGEGGPKTQYAKTEEQNMWTVGEKIIPITLETARKWAEEHLDGDVYESIFGIVRDDETVTAAYRITKSTHAKLRRAAAEAGITQQQLVQDILDRALS